MKRPIRLPLSAKRFCPAILFTVALWLPLNASATAIDIVSQQYSIRGTGFGTFPPEADLKFVSFNETTNHPLSRSVSNAMEFQGIVFGSYSIDTLAEGGTTSRNGATVHVHVAAFDEGNAFASGQLSARIDFRPEAASLLVEPWFSEPGNNLVSLVDLTANLTLLAINSPGNNQPQILSFNPAHLYAMSVMTGEINNASVDLSLSVRSSAPEASTLSLLGIGFFGLVLLKKRPRPKEKACG